MEVTFDVGLVAGLKVFESKKEPGRYFYSMRLQGATGQGLEVCLTAEQHKALKFGQLIKGKIELANIQYGDRWKLLLFMPAHDGRAHKEG